MKKYEIIYTHEVMRHYIVSAKNKDEAFDLARQMEPTEITDATTDLYSCEEIE